MYTDEKGKTNTVTINDSTWQQLRARQQERSSSHDRYSIPQLRLELT